MKQHKKKSKQLKQYQVAKHNELYAKIKRLKELNKGLRAAVDGER